MRKILYQWAGVGILSLIGWGVDLMPDNTSWIPSVTLWAVAGIWFIATLVYLWKNRGKRQREVAKETESENLTDVLTEMHKTSQKIQPTIGIDADESLIKAPKAKIINQDIGVKSRKSIIDIPDSYYTGYYSDSVSQIIVLYKMNEDYRYQVIGSKEGSYILNIISKVVQFLHQ